MTVNDPLSCRADSFVLILRCSKLFKIVYFIKLSVSEVKKLGRWDYDRLLRLVQVSGCG